MLQVVLFQLEALGIRVHHEILASARENHDFIFRVRADGFEKLTDGTMIFDTQLDRTACRVRLNENDTVLTPLQFVMLLEALLIFLELWGGNKIYERHD